jgi:hypothetical protein
LEEQSYPPSTKQKPPATPIGQNYSVTGYGFLIPVHSNTTHNFGFPKSALLLYGTNSAWKAIYHTTFAKKKR